MTMEKKTIGKFISALRKANGMTQRELGEKLFVSDKTVSRWECDECTPELSLIPTIAEIFGITTDELLRGERNNPERETANSDESTAKQKAKSDKQFRLMLDTKNRKYKNLSLISVGITILGFIAAMIANLGFSEGLIAFCLAAAFCVASEIAQICFAVNARILPDEDDDTYKERTEAFNTQTVVTAIKISFVNILLLAFCLPLITMINGANYGLQFDSWIEYGIVFTAVAFLITYIVYKLFIHKILCEHRLIVLTEEQTGKIKRENRLLCKTISISIVIALVLGIGSTIWENIGLRVTIKKHIFDSCTDFKAFMENDYDTWFREGYSYLDKAGNRIPTGADESKKKFGHINNPSGEIICEFYYNPELYYRITPNEASEDIMPMTVIRTEDYYRGRQIFHVVETVLYALIVMDFVVAASVYCVKINKRKKSS